jgi:hypothetical protein
MHQVRTFAQKAIPLPHRFADQAQFAVFQIAETPMDDARGAACNPRSEIILLDKKGALARSSTLPGHGHSVDPATNDDDVEGLPVQ